MPDHRYHVRPVSDADAGALQAIYASCVAEADWLPEHERTGPDFARSSRGESVHVATAASGEIVGLISVWTMETFIHHLYVAPQHRGTGVGRALLASLTAWLAPPWRLKCVRRNQRAYDFYRALDWREMPLEQSPSENAVYALLEWRPCAISS